MSLRARGAVNLEPAVRGGLWTLLSVVSLLAWWGMMRYEAVHYTEFEIASFSMLAARSGQPCLDLSAMGPIGYYSPLCYALPALIGRVSGTAHDPKIFFLTGRMTVFAFSIASAFLLWRLARRASNSPTVAVLCLFVLFHPSWAVFSFRPDRPALFFALCAFACACSKRKSAGVLAGVLAAVSFLYCQRYLSVFLAVGIYWAWMRRTRDVVYFASAFSAAVLTILSVFAVLSGGRIWTHSFLVPLTASPLTNEPLSLLMSHPPVLALVALALVVSVRRLTRFEAGGSSLAAIYSVVAVAAGACFMRSPGAAPNQLLEPAAACTLALLFHHGESRPSVFAATLKKLFIVLLIVISAAASFELFRSFRADLLGTRGRYDDTFPHDSAIRRHVKGPVLSDSEAVAYRSGNPEAANEGWYYEGPLKAKGLFDPEKVVQKISSKYYATVVTQKDSSVLMRLFGDRIRAAYRPLIELGRYEIWVPANGERAPAA